MCKQLCPENLLKKNDIDCLTQLYLKIDFIKNVIK